MFSYGMTRNWVAGMKVVTGKGDVLELNKDLIKNATGYDMRIRTGALYRATG